MSHPIMITSPGTRPSGPQVCRAAFQLLSPQAVPVHGLSLPGQNTAFTSVEPRGVPGSPFLQRSWLHREAALSFHLREAGLKGLPTAVLTREYPFSSFASSLCHSFLCLAEQFTVRTADTTELPTHCRDLSLTSSPAFPCCRTDVTPPSFWDAAAPAGSRVLAVGKKHPQPGNVRQQSTVTTVSTQGRAIALEGAQPTAWSVPGPGRSITPWSTPGALRLHAQQ